MFINKNQIQSKKRLFSAKRGMSFVEAIIGIFMFVVLMLAVTNIFASSFGGYKKADKMAKNIENAQYVMNLMAKSLRTSKIISPAASFSGATTVLAYDYSEGRCNEYAFDGGVITRKYKTDATAVCDMSVGAAGPNSITAQYVYGHFSGVPSAAPVAGVAGTMGKVTIMLNVCSALNCAGTKNDSAVLQTTVSLRDYSTVGL